MKVNPMWPVYLINMENDEIRLKKSVSILSEIGMDFERIEAIDGRKLSVSDIEKSYDESLNNRCFKHPLLHAEIGCYLSHRLAWQKIVDGESEGAFIFEDDFSVTGDLKTVIRAVTNDKQPWDIIKLYTRRPHKKMFHAKSLGKSHKLVKPYNIPNTTLAYAIKRDAAKKLLEEKLPFYRPVDEDHKRFWEHGLDIRLVLPVVLAPGTEAMSENSIERTRKSTLGRRNLNQAWRNLRYRIGYLISLNFYRLLGR